MEGKMQTEMPYKMPKDDPGGDCLGYGILLIIGSIIALCFGVFVILDIILIVLGCILVLVGIKSGDNKKPDTPYASVQDTQTAIVFNQNYYVASEEHKKTPLDISNLMKELNDMTGLNQVKHEIATLINIVKINKLREEKELKQSPLSLHLVFSGNPGTGKTTVARILAKIYHRLGILSRGHLIETDREGMVAGYVGQTAIKTKEIIEKARGGILFIDEAYSLAPSNAGNDFGQEAVDTLLKAMEDYRDDFIVIVAGYPELMKSFLKSNPGLQSRFNTFINFEDYNPDELLEIFTSFCTRHNYIVEPGAVDTLTGIFEDIYSNEDGTYANARTVRNFFEKSIQRQANRLANSGSLSESDLQTLVIEDFLTKRRRECDII
jgi:SpoVK/Ycf46/Vps4 family AAA+-type ATPase